MDWMLTDEEIRRVRWFVDGTGGLGRSDHALITAEARKLVEWLEEPCYDQVHDVRFSDSPKRWYCDACREQLRKELGLEE